MAKSSIVGLARLQRKLKRLPEAVRGEIKLALEKSADQIVAAARALAPFDDGDLRDSIGWTWGAPPRGSITLGKMTRAGLGKDLTLTIYAGNDDAFYARWVEFGTAPHENGGLFAGTQHPGTAAQPFFYPSFRSNKKEARRRIRKAVNDAAKKVARSS